MTAFSQPASNGHTNDNGQGQTTTQ